MTSMVDLSGASAIGFIDDDPMFVDTLGRWQTSKGLEYRATTEPTDILKWVRDGSVTTIVSDLRMPGIDGVSLLENVRTASGSVQLVLLTAFLPTRDELSRLENIRASVHLKGGDLSTLLDELAEGNTTFSDVKALATPRRRPTRSSPALHSVFLSYGGPDEAVARAVYEALTENGARVFFFPESAVPGRRLHRTMSEGIQSYDRVVLLCSSSSLARPGVLNELDQVLAREAAEGGTELLIPVALDGYVYSEWAPPRADLGWQVRNRVIADFRKKTPGTLSFDAGIAQIIAALTKR